MNSLGAPLRILFLAACTSPCLAAVNLSVTTNKPTYSPGDTLLVTLTATNPDSTPATLNFSTAPFRLHYFDSTGNHSSIGHDDSIQQTIAPNSSYTWTDYLKTSSLPLGSHQIVGQLAGYPVTASAPFTLVPPTYVTSNLKIKFDRPSITDYWRDGVHFGSRGLGTFGAPTVPFAAEYASAPTDGYLTVGYTTYPTGFNIFADLDIPVSTATVDVSSAVGHSVTLLAKDAAGLILASVTSPPVATSQQFYPLTIHSPTATPIASLEWWPSAPNATVLIDNLSLTIPEPQTLALLSLPLAIRRRRPT